MKKMRRYLFSIDCHLSRLTNSITLYVSLSVCLWICLCVHPEGALWSYNIPFVFRSVWPKHGWTDGWMAGWLDDEEPWRRTVGGGEAARDWRKGKYVLHPSDFQPVSSVDRPNLSGGGPLHSSVRPLTPLHNTTAAGLTFHHRLVFFTLILFQLAFFSLSFQIRIIILPCQKWIWNKNGKTAKLPRVE